MKMKQIRIILFYMAIILAMTFTYLVIQNRYSFERTHRPAPATTPRTP